MPPAQHGDLDPCDRNAGRSLARANAPLSRGRSQWENLGIGEGVLVLLDNANDNVCVGCVVVCVCVCVYV